MEQVSCSVVRLLRRLFYRRDQPTGIPKKEIFGAYTSVERLWCWVWGGLDVYVQYEISNPAFPEGRKAEEKGPS